jgi:hypothetical protein
VSRSHLRHWIVGIVVNREVVKTRAHAVAQLSGPWPIVAVMWQIYMVQVGGQQYCDTTGTTGIGTEPAQNKSEIKVDSLSQEDVSASRRDQGMLQVEYQRAHALVIDTQNLGLVTQPQANNPRPTEDLRYGVVCTDLPG